MGQSSPTANAGDTTAQALQSYTQYLPGLLQTLAGQTQSTGQTEQNAQNVLAPQQQALQNSLVSHYLPGLYSSGDQLNQQESTAGINQANTNLNSQGGQALEQQAIQQSEASNPQYYAALNQAGGQLSNLLSSINLGGLTGSEQAQVERSNAQQDAQRGILNSPSQTATVSNAMNFGTALQNKQNLLANAINTATSFLPQAKTGVDTFAAGSGAATTPSSNPAASQFLGVNGGNAASTASASNSSTANNLLNNVTSQQNNANSLNNAFGTNESISSYLGSVPT